MHAHYSSRQQNGEEAPFHHYGNPLLRTCGRGKSAEPSLSRLGAPSAVDGAAVLNPARPRTCVRYDRSRRSRRTRTQTQHHLPKGKAESTTPRKHIPAQFMQSEVRHPYLVLTLHTWHSRAAFALSNKPGVAAADEDDAVVGSAPTLVMGALAAATTTEATAASPPQLRHEPIVSPKQWKVPSRVSVASAVR